MLYTASYQNPLAFHGKRISISLGTPNFVQIDGTLDFFKPSSALLSAWKNSAQDEDAWFEYCSGFWALMERRRAMIEHWLSSLKPGQTQTLLCYEKSDQHCHRSLVANLIQKHRPDLWGGREIPRFIIGDRVAHRTVDKGIGTIVNVTCNVGLCGDICTVIWDAEPVGEISISKHPYKSDYFTNKVHAPITYPETMLTRKK